MAKTLMLSMFLLLSAAWLSAQDQAAQGSNPAANSGPTTTQGCLQGHQGTFTLVSDTGSVYQLQGGDSKEMSKHLRHEVEVTGTMEGGPEAAAAAGATSSPGAAMAGKSTIPVQDMKEVAKKCTNSGK